MSLTKAAIAASVVGGLYLVTKSDERAPSVELDLPTGPSPLEALKTATPSPVQQATGNQFSLNLQPPSGSFVTREALAQGAASARFEQRVSGWQLIERLGTGDTSIFGKPYTARQVNEYNERGLPTGMVNTSHPYFKNDRELKRMTIALTDWGEYRFFGTLLAIGYVMAEDPDDKKKVHGLKLLDWFFYHRWTIASGLQDKMAQAAYEASCQRKYKRAPKHYHRNYPIHWEPDKTNPGGPARRMTRGQRKDIFAQNLNWHERYGAYPALSDWGKAADGHEPYSRTGHIDGPFVPLACWMQDEKSPGEAKARFIEEAGESFWGITHDGKALFGPCGAMVEYAGARFAQLMLCRGLDPKLGQAAGAHLMGALQAAGGLALSALAAGLAAAMGLSMSIPVAGWIAAAVMAVGSAILGAVGVVDTQNKVRKLRSDIAANFNGLLLKSGKAFGVQSKRMFRLGLQEFSGHRMGLVIPPDSNVSGVEWHWDEITDPLFSHFAMSRSLLPAHSIPQLPPHYLGIEFALPIGLKLPALDGQGYLMVLQPICRSGLACREREGEGEFELRDECPSCFSDGEVLQDCPKANDGVVGFRDCAPSFTQYARYLGKDGKARHKDLETAILSSRNSTRAVDEAEVTGVELENTIGYGVLVAAIFASGALFL